MFEQDLQGRINQLFERIEAQLRGYLRAKMREGEGYSMDETLLAKPDRRFVKDALPLCP